MTQSEIINCFIEDLRDSLTKINELYYGQRYWDNSKHMFYNKEQKFETLIKYLDKYQERVFCYELYHQLRSKMERRLETNDQQNIYFTRNVFLQSELTKFTIDNYIENIFETAKLSKEFMPDFLLHTPTDSENQLIVMEVKTNPKLLFKNIKYDLLKIQEFIKNYKYLQGIFLATNIEDNYREKIIQQTKEWAKKEISVPNQIKLIFKNKPNDRIYEYNISEL